MLSKVRSTLFLFSAGAAALAAGGCAITPEPLSSADLATIGQERVGRLSVPDEPLPRVVTLGHAINRAIKYNLDHDVELAEQQLRRAELDLAHYSLLPNVVAGAGYAGRDKFNASNSVNVLTGVESLATSTSQDKILRTSDLAFSWNILDFGLSYIRARQSADKVLIQEELRRKIKLRIIEDTRSAYWRAVNAQRLAGRVGALEQEARRVELEARRLGKSGETSALTALTYEREIVEIQRTLGELQRAFIAAKSQLAALMNVRPGTKFAVAIPVRPILPKAVTGSMDDLIQRAMIQRPELRELEYRKRINAHEAHAALLDLLPGLTQVAGVNYDSNSFLLHGDWLNWGTRASWNLIKVFSYPARRAVVEQQDELLAKRGLALTMAVMTQIYVSRARHAHSVKEFDTASKYLAVQRRLLDQILSEAASGRISSQTAVREKLNTLVAEVKHGLAYSEVYTAHANLRASIGMDLAHEIANEVPPQRWASVVRH